MSALRGLLLSWRTTRLLSCLRKNIGARETQIHEARARDAATAPLRNGANGYVT